QAQLSVDTLSVGTYGITAEYGGATNYAPSTGTLAGDQTVDPAVTTTTLGTSGSPSTYGALVTFTATVVSGAGTPTGSVQFKVEGVNLETPVALDGSGQAQLSVDTLSVGTYGITAEYGGATNYAPSTGTLAGDQDVNPAPTTTTITADAPDPSVVDEVVTVTFTVTSAAGTPTGNVTVSDGAGTECTESVAVGQCNLTFTTAGAKILTATYAGGGNFAGSVSVTEAHAVN
ncbi:MAG: Ig-like domain-containing protein, partial [Gemmatimonadota bacterium]|nr:Ig-like domain-containing protein [Gemmatimonadota bacterium]